MTDDLETIVADACKVVELPLPKKRPLRQRAARLQAKHELAAAVQNRVTRITDAALKRIEKQKLDGSFDLTAAMIELEEARRAALASFPVQAGAAVMATVNKAKLAGVFIERSETGRPGTFAGARDREDIFRIIEQQAGPNALELFKQFMTQFGNSKLIEARAEASIEDLDGSPEVPNGSP